jgi:dTDP-4-amino-4,6-dideoxygalactose transaminase
MIPFNKPSLTGKEIEYILDASNTGQLAGDGKYTLLCQEILKNYTGCKNSLLTHSCTAALEMCALLADLQPGDEVIMPSYTFVSTANAFCLRGATPVFVDIRKDTLNLDEKLVKDAITSKTKAVVAVHYAGIACEMDFLANLCQKYNILFIEDAAQALGSKYNGKSLGSFGDLATLSFHETKNIISGEGGSLLINNESFTKQAEIIRAKGTNRTSFDRGETKKYTWHSLGSSFLPGELIAAFLYAQLEHIDSITKKKLDIWKKYYDGLRCIEEKGFVKLPIVPKNCEHNGHLFFILVENQKKRNELIDFLKSNSIHSVFHYVPLHSSPAGIRYGRCHGSLSITEDVSSRLIRLPSWIGMNKTNKIISSILHFYN